MKILTTDNKPFEINNVPDKDIDIQFCILDYSNPKDVDYFFKPLVFLETFSAPSVEIKIANNIIQMPIDWSIIIGDKETGDVEVINVTSINERDFNAYCLNPISGKRPEWFVIEILNIYPEIKWYSPKLDNGHILTVPLNDKYNPLCVFLVKDTNKLPDNIDISNLI